MSIFPISSIFIKYFINIYKFLILLKTITRILFGQFLLKIIQPQLLTLKIIISHFPLLPFFLKILRIFQNFLSWLKISIYRQIHTVQNFLFFSNFLNFFVIKFFVNFFRLNFFVKFLNFFSKFQILNLQQPLGQILINPIIFDNFFSQILNQFYKFLSLEICLNFLIFFRFLLKINIGLKLKNPL